MTRLLVNWFGLNYYLINLFHCKLVFIINVCITLWQSCNNYIFLACGITVVSICVYIREKHAIEFIRIVNTHALWFSSGISLGIERYRRFASRYRYHATRYYHDTINCIKSLRKQSLDVNKGKLVQTAYCTILIHKPKSMHSTCSTH